jgi:hypothetical protein
MRHATWIVLGLLACSQASGTESDPVESLKDVYLACDHAATQRRLTPAEAMQCSIVAEQLLQRGFDGDLDRLLAWWKPARTPRPSA